MSEKAETLKDTGEKLRKKKKPERKKKKDSRHNNKPSKHTESVSIRESTRGSVDSTLPFSLELPRRESPLGASQ